MSNLFRRGNFSLASGEKSDFKIDCDALSEEDMGCIAYLLSRAVGPFSMVEGVPKGGLRLAKCMREYTSASGPLLIVDDVYTTGGSILRFMIAKGWNHKAPIGAVIFARNPPPNWVTPLFSLRKP